ncbi:MAG: AMP-binding protein [Liquorilactobacillus mali]|uniref:AMP-binding protein n=1 Tax=Liquorilactobacillus mali TaxID=1618 RepID=UPI0039ED2B1C
MTKLTTELAMHLKKNVNREFLKDERMNKWFTGKDVEEDITKLQKIFLDAHMGSGDIAFMCLENSAAYIPINQALWRLGVTAHPVSESTSDVELVKDFRENHYAAIIFNDSRAEVFSNFTELDKHTVQLHTFEDLVILTRNDLNIGEKEAKPNEQSYGWILNTSGTTGKPKKVGLTHEIMLKAAHYDMESHRLSADDTVLIIMPMFHINAQELIVVSTLLSDGRLVIAPKFSASRFWQQVMKNDVTWSSVVPTIVSILLKNEKALAQFDPNHKLRFVRCASAMLPVSRHKKFVKKFGVPLLEGYGMTESCSQCTLNPLDNIKIGSVGKPYHTDVTIIDGDDFTDAPGIHGEIAIRGDHVITSYLDPHPDSFKDGWFLTGDLGYFDEEGYLWLEGRSKDVINHGGEKVSPSVVEDVLGNLDFIKQVAVVGLPDELYGEIVAAAVIDDTKDSETLAKHRQRIIDYAATHLAKYRRPTEIFFLDEFPLNPTRKILRPKLAEILQEKRTVK